MSLTRALQYSTAVLEFIQDEKLIPTLKAKNEPLKQLWERLLFSLVSGVLVSLDNGHRFPFWTDSRFRTISIKVQIVCSHELEFSVIWTHYQLKAVNQLPLFFIRFWPAYTSLHSQCFSLKLTVVCYLRWVHTTFKLNICVVYLDINHSKAYQLLVTTVEPQSRNAARLRDHGISRLEFLPSSVWWSFWYLSTDTL